jgi:tRNA(Ile)-lysidine synthase
LRLIEAHLPPQAAGLAVALSGGADSAALLAACAAGRAAPGLARPAATPVLARPGLAVRAVHVDHGLQAAAAELRHAAATLAARFGVPFSVLEVRVACDGGESIEAAARRARYAALAADLAPDECLLTAHHREDQAETLLLQALRGAGLKGLAGMAACRALGRGWHVRPLLAVSRQALREFGAAHAAAGMEDPMNLDARFERSHLRRALWPALEARWPGAGAALARVAGHAAEAQALLESIAAEDLAALADGDALSVPRLRRLPPPRQVNALRHWIGVSTAAPLPAARLAEALRQLLEAAPDHQPAIVWDGRALRRYRQRIFIAAAEPPRLHGELAWRLGEADVLELGPGLGRLRRIEVRGGWQAEKLPPLVRVLARRGGENLKPAPGAATRSVQHLFQSLGVLPWMRDALPFIHAGDALIGVADHWRDAHWCADPQAPGIGCAWEDAPMHL